MRLIKLILIIFIFSAVSVHYPSIVVSSAEAKTHKSRNVGKSKKRSTPSANPGNVWERIRSGIRIPVPNPAAGLENIVFSNPISSVSASSIHIKSASNEAPRNEAIEQDKVGSNSFKLPKINSKLSDKLRIRQVLMPHQSEANPSASDYDAKYTKLGQSLLGSKKSDSQLTNRLTKKVPLSEAEKLASAKSESLFKTSVGRIRTRLGLHPDLSKIVNTTKKTADSSPQSIKSVSGDKPKSLLQSTAVRNCSDLRKKEIIELAKEGILTDGYTQMVQQCRAKQIAIDERIAKQLAAFSKGFLYDVSERARPYLYHIVDSLNKHGLPLDLALLPIMESAYKSTALSSASASGLWQFIPSTGLEYGLEQSAYYDARRDVIASTEAAVRFLASLSTHYKGDWLLTLAAYNWGPGNVDAAIAQNQIEGLDTDYWSLELPEETQNYVPRLLALARIFSNPSGFGLNLRPLKNEPYFIKVAIDRENDIDQLFNKDLSTVAKLANLKDEEFNSLNSAYLNSTLTEHKRFSFLMPINNANVLHQSLAFLAKSNKNESHVLPFPHAWALSSRPLESKFEMPLLAINLINDGQKQLSSGDITSNDAAKLIFNEAEKSNSPGESYMTVHYLDKGESLKSLAEYHGLSEEKLRQVNKIKRKQSVSLGQRLLIPIQLSTGISLKSIAPSVLYNKL